MKVLRISEDTAVTAYRALVKASSMHGLSEDDRACMQAAERELNREWQRTHPEAAVKPVVRRGAPRWKRLLRKLWPFVSSAGFAILAWAFAVLFSLVFCW